MIPFLNDLFSAIGNGLGNLLRPLLPADLVALVITLLGAGLILTFLAVCVMLAIWAERKVIARIQDRVGPNRVGPFGLMQSVADVLKLFSKEDTIPGAADRKVFILAPLIALVPSLMIYAVLPWNWDATVTRLDVGILYVLALATFPTLAILIAGWASANKYTLLGGMRAAAQLISYEVPEVLSVIPVVMLAGSLSLWNITQAQQGAWFILAPVVGPLAFLVFFTAGLAECNRSPFDLVEAESEIIAGFHMEYSGMRWALFYLAEYANAFTVSAVSAVLFFGGWHGPLLPGYAWVVLKTALLFVVMIWIRGTLPRFRYDQLMALAWKGLLPVSLVNIVLAAVVKELHLMELIPWPLLLLINLFVVWLLLRWYTDIWRAAQLRAAAPIFEAATQGARS